MNEAQKTRLEEIQDKWLNAGCPWEVEEDGDIVYIYPLSVPGITPNGTAIKIDRGGEFNWVVRYPKTPVEEPKRPAICEVEGCDSEVRFYPHSYLYSDKLKRKVGLCEVHFRQALDRWPSLK